MSPRSKTQLNELKHNKRKIILDAALKVFSDRGFNGATMSDIAREAGIAKGLTYTYFSSKEVLLSELMNHGLEQLDKYAQFIPEKGITSKKELKRLLENMISMYLHEKDFWRLYITVILQRNIPEEFQQTLQQYISEYLGVFARYFEKKKVVDPLAEAMLFGAALDGLMFDMILAPETFPMERIIDTLVRKFG